MEIVEYTKPTYASEMTPEQSRCFDWICGELQSRLERG